MARNLEPYWGYYVTDYVDWILESESGVYKVTQLLEDEEVREWVDAHKDSIIASVRSKTIQEKLKEFGIDAELSESGIGDIEHNDEVLVVKYHPINGFRFVLFKKIEEG